MNVTLFTPGQRFFLQDAYQTPSVALIFQVPRTSWVETRDVSLHPQIQLYELPVAVPPTVSVHVNGPRLPVCPTAETSERVYCTVPDPHCGATSLGPIDLSVLSSTVAGWSGGGGGGRVAPQTVAVGEVCKPHISFGHTVMQYVVEEDSDATLPDRAAAANVVDPPLQVTEKLAADDPK